MLCLFANYILLTVNSVQFKMVSMCLGKPIKDALHPVSQKFPQCCLWNSSNVHLTMALSHPFKCSGRAVQASSSYGPWVPPTTSLQSDAACQRLAGAARCGIKDSACPVSVHSSGAVWESRWTSWAVRPNEPSGFRGRKDLLHRASALVTTCP